MPEWDTRRFKAGQAATEKQLETLRRRSLEIPEAGSGIEVSQVGNLIKL